MTEEWKSVVGYEGIYEVSSIGRVRSLDRKIEFFVKGTLTLRLIKGRILRPAASKFGHLCVVLNKNGTGITFQVHALVLRAFVGERPDGMECCHNDSNPSNNEISNLRWDTRSGNEKDKVAQGTSNRGVRNRAAKLTEKQALEIKNRVKLLEPDASIAADYPFIGKATVKAIRHGRAWSWL